MCFFYKKMWEEKVNDCSIDGLFPDISFLR